MNNKVTFKESYGPPKVSVSLVQGALYRRSAAQEEVLIATSKSHAIDPGTGDIWITSTTYERVYGRLVIESERE